MAGDYFAGGYDPDDPYRRRPRLYDGPPMAPDAPYFADTTVKPERDIYSRNPALNAKAETDDPYFAVHPPAPTAQSRVAPQEPSVQSPEGATSGPFQEPTVKPPTPGADYVAAHGQRPTAQFNPPEFSTKRKILGGILSALPFAGPVASHFLFTEPRLRAKADYENQLEQQKSYDTGLTQAEQIGKEPLVNAETQANTKEATARAGFYERGGQARAPGSPDEQTFASLLKQANPNTGKPYTEAEALEKIKTIAQDTKADKEPGRDDKAIAIMAKPQAQWTPQDQAYMRGYDSWVKKTKTDPGVVRIEALGDTRPVQATDSTTGKEVFISMTDVNKSPGRYIPLPTGTTRTMQEMAASVRPQAEAVSQQVDALTNKLGPDVGRWNELWVNKVGFKDPEFAKLDENLGLLASAIVRTHFGASGGQEYMNALKKDFGEAQNPENLKARIAAADSWLEGYAAMSGRSGQEGGGKGAGGGGGQHGGSVIYARDPQGNLHKAAAGTALPQGWKQENAPAAK